MSNSDPSSTPHSSGSAATDEASTDQAPTETSLEGDGEEGMGVSDDESQNRGDDSDTTCDSLSAFLENVRAPIDEDRRAGESILYDEDFRTLKTQIDEIGSASGEADYEEIVHLARSLLTEKAKDLRAAGYLVIGGARLNGAAGVAEGVHAVRLLVDNYWNDLFPEMSRMKGRGSALQFIADRLPDWLEAASFEPQDREHLVRVVEHLTSIQEFSLQEMGEHAPSFSGLIRDLEGEIESLPAPDPEPDPEPEVEGEPSSTDAEEGEDVETKRTTADSGRTKTGGGPEEVESETDALQAIRRVAGYYREEDRSNPISYRLLRAVRWGMLQSEPSNDGGSTRFAAPREQRRTYLEGLLEDDEYETLVREAEASFESGTFHVWFDLQRLVVAALDALGTPYQDARAAVLFELAQVVRRVPSLLSLNYRDGTPFASPLTVDWIETEVLPDTGREEDRTKDSGAFDGLGAVTEDYEEARSELSRGDLARALSIMSKGAAADRSTKAEFHRQLYMASLCVKGGEVRVARPLLDELVVAIDTYSLDAWNPSLALEVWTTRLQCYDLLADDAGPDESKSLRSEAEVTFEKICRIDPERAVTVDSRRAV